ncbi:MAG: hypothetical protein ABII12_03590 [Planctomycetota bacterium]
MTKTPANNKKLPSYAQRVLSQVDEFELTTRAVVTTTLARGKKARAHDWLRRLTDVGKLFRHEHADGDRRFVYYARHDRPIVLRHLRRAFATLWLCRICTPHLKLLTEDELLRLAGVLLDAAVPELPKHVRCVLYPVQGESVPRIALLRIHGQSDPDRVNLNRAVTDIDRIVSLPAFRLWHRLALLQRFAFVYLIAGEENAAELGRWLQRRPPVSRVATTAVTIDVHVRPAEPLHYGYA